MYGECAVCTECGNLEMDTYEVDPETVGQYTGLKDKNGKEIYEGDIVTCGAGLVPTCINWNDTNCAYYALNPRRNEYHRLDRFFKKFIGAVIGNIYDNPELLEEHYDY